MQNLDIGEWLEELGLGQYRALFSDQAIDSDVVPDLTDDDLARLGLPLGHRKKLLKAIDLLLGRERTSQHAPVEVMRIRPDAERRQLTVLICDLVESTVLASKLDPEELRKVMGVYLDACVNVVTSFGGFIARYTGDGIVAYFGYPAALEDAAERAVRAGLELSRIVPNVVALPGKTLRVRTGIATGLVVVGDLLGEGAAKEESVVGETPALAARLQTLAPPNGVAIAGATRRLIEGMFELEFFGMCDLKGLPGLRPVWCVLREAAVESRFAARHRADLTEVVGREDELSLLLGRWKTACEGERQLILLGGEAGIGKSRLCMALASRIAAESHFIIRMQCSPFHTDSALHPIATYFERVAGLTLGMEPEEKLNRLSAEMQKSGNVAPETMVLFADLLSIPTGDRLPRHEAPPEQLKSLTLDAIDDWVVNLSRLKPVLWILEDAHWIDPTTVEAISRGLARTDSARILAVVTHRPEYHPPWPGRGQIVSFNLNRLSRRQSQELVRRVAKKDLPSRLVEQIVAKTDGMPLFIEELTKVVVESGPFEASSGLHDDRRGSGEPAIPVTLQDSLLARLDRLTESKAVAQIGAVIGREFSYGLLAAVVDSKLKELQAALALLEAADLISARGSPPEVIYTFKHALLQEAAYSTLLISRRQTLHQRIAETLQSQFAEIAEVHPELLAHHFIGAGLISQAVDWLARAAARSAGRYSNIEAVSQFDRALMLLQQLPDEPARRSREFALRIELIEPLYATHGYSGPEVEHNYGRLLELGQELKQTGQLLRILWGRAGGTLVRCDFPRTDEYVGSFLELARQTADRTSSAQGIRIRAMVALASGEFVRARELFLEVIEEFEREGTATTLGNYLTIPRPTTLGQYSIAAQQLGHLGEARELCARSLQEAREYGHHLTSCYAIHHCAMKSMVEQDPVTVSSLAEEIVEIMNRHHVFYWELFTEALLGWASAMTGALDAGFARLQRSREIRDRVQTRIWSPYFLISEAEILMRNQRNDEAIALLDRAAAEAEATGQHYSAAEGFRVRACARLAQGASLAETEALLQRALTTAQVQNARLFELRAATSLAQVWRDAGRFDSARRLLEPTYRRFTDGHDTPDLRNSRAVLETLS
ncbi:AAA family ATPase [Bradyrhizobium sp. BRP22]|uniref:AAA family ATPase n=1 Tax=Bradyrhizobium sp. BRP22 TaxID=2793821 RepID=UPI001CD2564D|nr:AAA family ATPase [Bradyrhizobium sp. BRP22]MCA1452699.1 AAA family ATPase [Bradyrhizobium sp. BRP22]